MKYTTKVKQEQYIGGVKLLPAGGELSEKEVEAITADPYGQDLIKRDYLVITGVKKEDVDKPKKKKPGTIQEKSFFEGMSREQLIAYAEERMIDVPEKGTVEEILAVIKKVDSRN